MSQVSRCYVFHSFVMQQQGDVGVGVGCESTAPPAQQALNASNRHVDHSSGSWAGFPDGLRVLAVDDDPLCLKVVEQMLKRCNYEGRIKGYYKRFKAKSSMNELQMNQLLWIIAVTTCANGNTALRLLRENPLDYDLVLSDVYMPGMSRVVALCTPIMKTLAS